MQSGIVALGTAVPIYKREQSTAAELIAYALQLKPAEKRLLRSIYRSTGIEYRHSVMSDFCKEPGEYELFPNDPNLDFPTTAARMRVYKEHALQLALSAIKDCLQSNENIEQQKITHVITVSCTGMYAPGLDIEIVQELKLATNVKRTAINFMGCYGAFNAIKAADAICKADVTAVVLIVSVELCTIHFQKNQSMDSIISNAIFSDGAAAILVQAQPRAKKYFSLEAFHCDFLPQHSHDMTWHISDSGFDIALSSYVPQIIESGIAQFTNRLLTQKNMQFADVDLFAIHPGGQKILQACEDVLSLTAHDNRFSYDVLRQFGNMSSATVLFVLKGIWNIIDSTYANKSIFSCAFGPGLTLESMLLKVAC